MGNFCTLTAFSLWKTFQTATAELGPLNNFKQQT